MLFNLLEVGKEEKKKISVVLYLYIFCTLLEVGYAFLKDSSNLIKYLVIATILFPLFCVIYLLISSKIYLKLFVFYMVLSAITALFAIDISWYGLAIVLFIIFYIAGAIYLGFIAYTKSPSSMIKEEIDDSKDWIWNWGGDCIGYLEDEFLWSFEGKLIGKNIKNEIFSEKGEYLAEIYEGNRRICIDPTKKDKKSDSYEIPSDKDEIKKQRKLSGMYLYPRLKDFNV
jgi:hypothetical protein